MQVCFVYVLRFTCSGFKENCLTSFHVQKISFDITIHNQYQIQNIESVNMAATGSSNSFVVTKDIGSGDTFDLVVVNQNLQSIESVVVTVSQDVGIPSAR